MSIRNRIVRGYALVLGIAIAGTVTGLMTGNHHQRKALANRDVAAAELQLLNELQIKILYNRPAKQLSPYLSDRDRFQSETQNLLYRVSEIQRILKEFAALSASAGHADAATDHHELHQLLKEYAETTVVFEQSAHAFLQEINALPNAPEALPTAQQMLLAFVQSPEFANFIQLPDQIAPFMDRVEHELLAASAALSQAESLRNQFIVGSLVASTVLAIIIALWTSQAIARPVTTVTQVARRVTEENDFDLQVPVQSQDEVGLLAASLNRLIQQVKQLLGQVQQKNTDLSEALTQLKQQQVQLVQSEKMSSLGQLVAGVAHEINNPVNFIHGNLTHIEEHVGDVLTLVDGLRQRHPDAIAELQDDDDDIDLEFIQEDLGKILSSMRVGTDRIRQIVLSLRNFSRLDESAFKAVNVHEGLESSLLILQHRLKAKPERPAIEVVRQYGKLPLVPCFPGQLNQVIMNVLTNGIDAIEERYFRAATDGEPVPLKITLKTRQMDQDWVEIAIADTGSGMTEAVRQKLFNAFFTTKPEGVGTGIGMSISHKIMTETHQGQLDCQSIPGQGTEFFIRIPIHRATNPESRKTTNAVAVAG